jgi:hypothetical protein
LRFCTTTNILHEQEGTFPALPTSLTSLELNGYSRINASLSHLSHLRALSLAPVMLQQAVDSLRLPTSLTALDLAFGYLDFMQPRWTNESSVFACKDLKSLGVTVRRGWRRAPDDEDEDVEDPGPICLYVPSRLSALTALTSLTLMCGNSGDIEDARKAPTRIVLPRVPPQALEELTLNAGYADVPRGYSCRTSFRPGNVPEWRTLWPDPPAAE